MAYKNDNKTSIEVRKALR